jgi:two-component system, OmpR family, osmolarity sensor histidine kinase EnvZ
VEDDGPGIPDEARDAVMEPFFRLEASRSRDSGGAGMGLAVVNSLVQAQSGAIDLQTPENGGSRFVVSFPEFRI